MSEKLNRKALEQGLTEEQAEEKIIEGFLRGK